MGQQEWAVKSGFSTVRTLMLACEEKSIPYRQHMEWQGEPVAMHSDSHFQLQPCAGTQSR